MQGWSGKISILTPVYNAGAYLDPCVESVLAQGDGNFELVLVDDGSTDGSGARADAIAAENPGRVRAFHQPNRGLILARRQGIALATGGVCMFLDADDMLAPGSLGTIRRILGETDADIVIFNYDNLYEPTGETETDEVLFADGSVFEGAGKRAVYAEMIATWRLNNLCMKAIKTPLVQEDDTRYEDFAHVQIGEDLLQSLYPVTRAARIAYCAKPLYIYRHMRGSMIGGAGARPPEDDAIERRFIEYVRLWGMDTPDMRAVYARRQAGNVLTAFWQAYRAADTRKKRRAVIGEDWRARLEPYKAYPPLALKKRAQLWALVHKSRPLLWLMERLGGRKLRKQYGK